MKFKYAVILALITTLTQISIAHATGPDCFGGEVQAINPQVKTIVTEIKKSSNWMSPEISCAIHAPGSKKQWTTESVKIFIDSHGLMELASGNGAKTCDVSTDLQKKLDAAGSFPATVMATSYEKWELDYSCYPQKKIGFACELLLESASPAMTFYGGMFDVKSREACEEIGSKL